MHAYACLFLLVLLHFYKLNILLQFRGILKMLKSDKDVRVMILRSAVPGVFCAGLWKSDILYWNLWYHSTHLVCFDHTLPGRPGVTQHTTTHDFTCYVSEFMSSTDSIHVNSLDSVNKFGVSIHISREITSFSHDDTCQLNHTSSGPVRLVSNSFKTRDNRQNTSIIIIQFL